MQETLSNVCPRQPRRRIAQRYCSLIAEPKVHFYIVSAIEGESSYSIQKILPQTKNSNFPVFFKVKELPIFHVLRSLVFDNDQENKTQDTKIVKLIIKINEIENLRTNSPWGAEYKIWNNLTEKLVKDLFGQEGLELFQKQQTVIPTDEGYLNELSQRKKILEGLLTNKEEYQFNVEDHHNEKLLSGSKFDVFISHASEDKVSFVEPLAQALKEQGVSVWYDNFELGWGDTLRGSIDQGLKSSKYGIVVFSKSFLKKKKWTEHELDGLFAMEEVDKKVILPIWHDISREDMLAYSPALADRLAKRSDKDEIADIVQEIKNLLDK
jgi:hypothetical protein